MKTSTILFLCSTSSLVAANGCNKGLPAGVTSLKDTYTAKTPAGRTFNYHLPRSYDGKSSVPVYFSFHGATKDAANQEALSGLSDPYFNPSGIAVYPEGLNHYWLSHPGVSQASPNDIDFTLDIIDWLESNLCIDNSRLYASGKSNGGGFVNLLACNSTTAGKFAAFAGVSGAYYQNKPARNCAPGRHIPFISFHGLNDSTIPYNGKKCPDDDSDCEQYKTTYPIDQWLKDWLARNDISKPTKPLNKTLYDGLVTRSRWSSASYVNITTHYKENDFGHNWPSTLPNSDCPAPSEPSDPRCPLGHYTFNATTIIMDFFERWTL